ncbi:MAG TPA: hypothetical protein VF832_06385 [Longimicrobiales bacterium]
MEVLCLNLADYKLLTSRFAEHGNSQLRLAAALEEAGAGDTLRQAKALRRMEVSFGVDLGSLCHRFEHRHDPRVHPIETMVMNFVAEWRGTNGKRELWVMLDRVRQVRDLMEEGQLAREPES